MMANVDRSETNGTLGAVNWVGRASMFCLGLAAMVVLAVVFAVVMPTMLAASVVPERETGRRFDTSR